MPKDVTSAHLLVERTERIQRSAGRIALSVLGAVGGAAVITLMLPFHELKPDRIFGPRY